MKPSVKPAAPAAQATPAATTPAAPVAPAVPTRTATLSEVGLEAASLDRSVDPCVDFYQFACGGWIAANQIPAHRARWGRFGEIDDKTKAALQTLLEETAAKREPQTQQLGDFYASCMDEAAIEKAGTRPIQPLLEAITRIKDPRSWFAALTELHKVGIWVVFQSWSRADLKNSTTYATQLWDGALGLRDRDYYVNPDRKDTLEAYRQHVARMLVLAGMNQPEAAAADVVAIESELAKVTSTATEKRDPHASYNPRDLKGLAKLTRAIEWRAYFKALGVTPSPKIVVWSPTYLAALDAIRKRFKPAQWRGYFTYHLVAANALALPKTFDDEAFALQRLVSGVTERAPRFKRCIDATAIAIGEVLGKAYVDKHFPPTARQNAAALVDAIANAMTEELGRLEWMSEPTRKLAQQKLGKVVKMIGYPDKWRSYAFQIKRDDFAGNQLRATAFEVRRILSRSGKTVDRAAWLMNTFTVDAYYNSSFNNTVLPAGILQPPFFGVERSVAANLGSVGLVIGHELTHAFDDQSSKFDAEGNLASWWTPEDKQKFEERGACVAKMYESFEVLPKQFINGRLTLGENIADMGGVKMAFEAYRALRKNAPHTVVADGFSEDQQFFLAVGQAWCAKVRPAETQRLLTVDPHSPPKFRVYGALRNLPAFSEAFQCAPGTPMHPAQTCSVW